MTRVLSEKTLSLRIDRASRATVYLSTSWQPDRGLDLSYRLAKSLDSSNVRVIGDARDLPDQDPSRIERIMSSCDGLLCVLPFRPADPRRTSQYILAELRLAVTRKLPIALLYDGRIGLKVDTDETQNKLTFGAAIEEVVLPSELVGCLQVYDVDVAASEAAAEAAIVPFRERVAQAHEHGVGTRIPPYAFLITRLKDDFARARNAISSAVESTTGVPCLWIDADGYQTNITNTLDRTRALIEHALFVVADLSLAEENSEFDNPSRAHEIGIAVAFRKQLFVTAQLPRRDPYHSLAANQLLFWSDEAELHSDLGTALYTHRASIGCHTYNWDLPRPRDDYTPRLSRPRYDPAVGKAHVAPSTYELGPVNSWVLAFAFALSALASSVLVKRFTPFDSTLDLASLVGAIFALVFSSNLSRLIRRQLARSAFLRVAVLIATAILVVMAWETRSLDPPMAPITSPNAKH